MPSFLALSARLSWMPVPGQTMTPIGRASSIASFRLKGAALACFVQSGLRRSVPTCGDRPCERRCARHLSASRHASVPCRGAWHALCRGDPR
jgi:hypothetical protein